MNRNKLKNEIEKCDREIFYLEMKDMWLSEDYKTFEDLTDRLRRLKMLLEIYDDVFGDILKDI